MGSKARTLWRWVALCRRTRQMVAWTLTRRPELAQSACDLRATWPKDYEHCDTRSDYWEAYATAFPSDTHRACGKHEGETNHVERWFGTLRARVGRLARKAYSFSKCAANHLDAIHLFITTYNLALQQKATVR